MTDCQHCTRKTELPLCTPCTQLLGGLLDELPWLLVQLEVTASHQDRFAVGLGRTGAGGSAVNVGAMELARSAAATLREIALSCPESHADPALAAAPPTVVVLWLRRHLRAIQGHPEAGRHYRSIRMLVGDTDPGPIHEAINRPDRRFAGPCPTVRGYDARSEPIRCGRMLYAHSGDTYVTCPWCSCAVDVERNRLRTIAENDLLPERLLLEALDNLGEHVPRVTLYGWIRAGRLQPRGYLNNQGGAVVRRRGVVPRLFSLAQARQLWLSDCPPDQSTG